MPPRKKVAVNGCEIKIRCAEDGALEVGFVISPTMRPDFAGKLLEALSSKSLNEILIHEVLHYTKNNDMEVLGHQVVKSWQKHAAERMNLPLVPPRDVLARCFSPGGD